MDLFDLLACPACRGPLTRSEAELRCSSCGEEYPIVGRVPILLPPGRRASVPNESELQVRSGYDPWVHRVVLESLPPSAISLEIGAGSMALDLPNVVRLDVGLTPYVDVVADSHALPFRAEAFDFVFSLAVVEHLQRPHAAAGEMHRVSKPGGYVYGECSFVFPYHGYPHHYFNATYQGLAEVFDGFTPIRRGVAPYQMPSFAIRAVLEAWSNDLHDVAGGEAIREATSRLLAEPLADFDANLSPQAALRCAAGTFLFGVKTDAGPSQVIPEPVRDAVARVPELLASFPEPLDLGNPHNVLRWAQGEGRRLHPAIDAHFASIAPFSKRVGSGPSGERRLGPPSAYDQVVSDVGLEGWLDGIVEEEERDEMLIGGWAADPARGAPVARVEVWIDDDEPIAAMVGGPRADVARVSGRSDYRLSGWSAVVPRAALAPGSHRVRAYAYGVHGGRALLSGERHVEVPTRG